MVIHRAEMMLKLWFLLFCVFLLRHRQLLVSESRNLILPSGDLSDKCGRLDHDYMKIVAQFYESVNLISIIFVHSHETDTSSTDLSSVLLESLPRGEHSLEYVLHSFEFIKIFWSQKSIVPWCIR